MTYSKKERMLRTLDDHAADQAHLNAAQELGRSEGINYGIALVQWMRGELQQKTEPLPKTMHLRLQKHFEREYSRTSKRF